MNIRVLLADDHKIVREGLISLLSRENWITVVGEADNGRSAVLQARELHPDVVVIDISMPDMNGIEASRLIHEDLPDCRILALSMHAEHRYVTEVLKAGASGYMLKDCASDELVMGIRAVAAGDTYLSPKVSTFLVSDYMKRLQEPPTSSTSLLSLREREVLRLLAEGKNTKEIAYSLDVSIKTIEAHRSTLMKKLNINNIAELTKFAIREGLTSLN